MEAVALLDDVVEAAEKVHATRVKLERDRVELYRVIRIAAAEGIPAARIARAARLSRERVRQIVGEAERRDR